MLVSQTIDFVPLANPLLYPDPSFRRKKTLLLDGDFSFKEGALGSYDDFSEVIRVPFAPESPDSGVHLSSSIGHDLAYGKDLILDSETPKGSLLLRIGASDFLSRVFLNGHLLGSHLGGYAPFGYDLSPFLHRGHNFLLILVHDDPREGHPSGKQSAMKKPSGCFYSRVSGIWQSVSLEEAPENRLLSFRLVPELKSGNVRLTLFSNGEAPYRLEAYYENRLVGQTEGILNHEGSAQLSLKEIHPWEAGAGWLYDLKIFYGEDEVDSYFGLREVGYDGLKFTLNGKPLFERFVMDQGYYGTGLYTPKEGPEAYKRDIALAQSLGFNGARLHQKIFDPRYLYLADQAGFLVSEEFPSWGVDYASPRELSECLAEWDEILHRDINHPSIVTWVPLNEAWENARGEGRLLAYPETLYRWTKEWDPSRPCLDVSGGHHGHATDLFDAHDFGDPDELFRVVSTLEKEGRLDVKWLYSKKKMGESIAYPEKAPVALSEIGGLSLKGRGGWGYHSFKNGEALALRYAALVAPLLASKMISGFGYVQLYDVEQERNGLYDEERKPKLSEKAYSLIRQANQSPAAIEV